MIRKMNKGHERLTKWALSNIDIKNIDTVLDVGCGGGNALRLMSKLSPESKVFGVDYSELSVSSAKKKNKKIIKSGRAEFIKASVSNLPYKDNSFDLVTAFETIYFWPKPNSDFKEVYRVVKNSGTFAVVCEMVKNEDGTGKHTDVAEFLDLHYFTKSEVENLFLQAGFKNIKTIQNEGWLCVIGKK